MNHLKVYNSIISNAKTQDRKKLKKNNDYYIYYENHHILPRCLDGGDEKENLVLLTAREHYVAHKLLTYIYLNHRGIACSFFRMTFDKRNNRNISSRDYAYARELFSLTPMTKETKEKISQSCKGRKSWNKNISQTTEVKEKISTSLKGKDSWMKNKTHSVETKIKMSNSHKGAVLTFKHRQKISNSLKGKIHTKETKEKIRKSNLGLTRTEETKINISNSHKGKKHSEETKQKMRESYKRRLSKNL